VTSARLTPCARSTRRLLGWTGPRKPLRAMSALAAPTVATTSARLGVWDDAHLKPRRCPRPGTCAPACYLLTDYRTAPGISSPPSPLCLCSDAGYYGVSELNSCLSCYNNYFSNDPAGQANCTLCPWGFTVVEGFLDCLACPAATYHANQTDDVCTSCPPGSYSQRTNATSCTAW